MYSILPDIFQCFSGYMRGVVVAHEVSNGPSPAELIQRLREAEQLVRAHMSPDLVAEEPRIRAWREAYRCFGARPSEFRSSVEAMARRALKGDEIPSINALVDIGNMVSLRHLVPVGSHAIDVLRGNVELRFATGREKFVAFGSDDEESPPPGEVIFAEGDVVLTRRWTWRQASHSLTLPETQAVEFNIDGLPPANAAEVEAACLEVAELVQRFCGGRIRVHYLTEDSPSISLSP